VVATPVFRQGAAIAVAGVVTRCGNVRCGNGYALFVRRCRVRFDPSIRRKRNEDHPAQQEQPKDGYQRHIAHSESGHDTQMAPHRIIKPALAYALSQINP
jgi:hypothetical protein